MISLHYPCHGPQERIGQDRKSQVKRIVYYGCTGGETENRLSAPQLKAGHSGLTPDLLKVCYIGCEAFVESLYTSIWASVADAGQWLT